MLKVDNDAQPHSVGSAHTMALTVQFLSLSKINPELCFNTMFCHFQPILRALASIRATRGVVAISVHLLKQS